MTSPSETPGSPAPLNDDRVEALEQQLVTAKKRAGRFLALFIGAVIVSMGLIALLAAKRGSNGTAPPTPSAAQFLKATQAAATARSRELTYRARTEVQTDPELAILLALEANKSAHTSQAEEALRESLLRYPLHATLRGHNATV